MIELVNVLLLLYLAVIIISPNFVFAEQINWTDDVRLTDDPADSIRPKIAIDSLNNIHVVWQDSREGNAGIYYKMFDGTSWSSDLKLNQLPQDGIHPAIAIDSFDNIHVVWVAGSPYEIYYTVYDGNEWSTPVPITVLSGYSITWGPQTGPTIVIDSEDYIYAFWTDASFLFSKDIVYVYNNGITWSAKQYVTNDPRVDCNHCNPDIILDSNDCLHAVYVTTEPADVGYYYNISYKKFDGNNWGEEKQINDYLGTAVNFPSVDADSMDNIHLTWVDARDDPGAAKGEIYYSKLDNEGNTLVPDVRLTNYTEESWSPSLRIDTNDYVHIVWPRSVTTGSPDQILLYTKLNDNGVKLLFDVNLTTAYYPSASTLLYPDLAIDSVNRLHIVFMDNRDGNLEIYYKSTHNYDLAINADDIQFSNSLPKNGENIFINATIYNNGGDLTNGTFSFYIDTIEEMNLIGSGSVSILGGESDNVSVEWNAITGTHIIWVKIECENNITESNLTNNIANKTIIVNDPPTISLTVPPSGTFTADTSYTLSWVANDPDDDAEITLYYDNDNTGHDGTLIDTSDQYPTGIVDNNGASQSYEWNTSALPDDSSWYIHAKIYDGIHDPLYTYSQGKLEIDHPNIPPVVEITSPTGGTVSGLITIQGTASDPDKGNIESVFVSIDDKLNWNLATGTTSWSWDWDTTKYSDGAHTIYAKAYDGEDSSEIVSVTVTVDNGGNKAPSVSITYPSDGATVSGEIEIRGTASDDDGFVQLVELRIDNGPWIELPSTTNWNWDWDTTYYTNGEHTIYARAKDDLGAYSQDKSITVIVNNGGNILPTVQITSHSGVEVVSGTIQIKGTAVDHDGNVESVEVKIDSGSWNAASGTTSWIYEWDTTGYGNGEHVIYARAKDDANEYSQMKSVTLIVNNGGNIPPIVSIASPAGGTVSGLVSVSGTATDLDGDGTIVSVQVKIDGDWENAEGTTDWSYDWDTTVLDDGNYTISVRAYDGVEYSMVKSVEVHVDNPHEPILTITSDIPEKVSGTINIKGKASDVDGEITKVEIQIDDGEWQEIDGTTDWSYELDTTKLSDGEHIIRIRALDDEGEYYEESFTIKVANSSIVIWLIIIVVVILLVGLITAVGLRRKKPKKTTTEPLASEPATQASTQSIKCPQCSNVFEVPENATTVQCPFCGTSGSLK